MPCELYKDALIEVAEGGGELADAANSDPQLLGLRAHLQSCASCRAALAQEQSLFAAIDSSLHFTANTKVPPSLLPRVRACLEELPIAPRLQWLQPLGFASVSVVLALLIFLIGRPHRTSPVDQARQVSVIPAPATPATRANPEDVPPGKSQIASMRAIHSRAPQNSTIPHSAASSNPEVLVPQDERVAFARFLSRNAADASVMAASAPKPPLESVEIFPVEIAALKVKPLGQDNNQQAEF